MTSQRRPCFQQECDYRLIYLQYERLHRSHPSWSLRDLKEMTPRQRKHWMAMGEVRREQRRTILEKGQVPLDG